MIWRILILLLLILILSKLPTRTMLVWRPYNWDADGLE